MSYLLTNIQTGNKTRGGLFNTLDDFRIGNAQLLCGPCTGNVQFFLLGIQVFFVFIRCLVAVFLKAREIEIVHSDQKNVFPFQAFRRVDC